MRSTLLINTRVAWRALKTVNPATCILSQLGDIHPENDGPVIRAHTIVLDQCNKKFAYYWLDERTFPCMKELILNSHPCEPGVVRWMVKRPHIRISVHQNWYPYINRWTSNPSSHIKPISGVEYRKLLNKLLARQHIIVTKN